MKRYLYIILCATLFTSCAKDVLIEQGTPGDGKTIDATFTLSPDFVEEIDVRSVAGVDEKVIKDLWVIQLDAGGTIQLQAPKYIETGLTTSASDYKVTVPLLRQASKIYFIANTHDVALYTTTMQTSALVEAVALTLTGEANLASANGIPMSGVWTGTPDLLGIAGRVSLSRAIAKVNFNLNASLPAGEVFTLKSVAVKQAPDKLNYYRDAAKLDVYPYPATPTIITDYSTAAYNEILNTTSKSLWWYLPENARGTGTATIQTDKGSKLPTGQAAYCTYLEVAGRYEAGGGTYNTTYKIYLGANSTNDYNVKRNTVYNVNTTIKGIDAADTRINTVDKSIIIGMFGGWDDTKKEYTKLLEVQCVETANDPQLKWANAEGATNATDIYYGITNIDILKGLNTDLSAYPAAKYCADLGNGWYLPSQNQLEAVWIANNAIPADFLLERGDYWSSMEKAANTSSFVNFNNGYTYFEVKTGSRRVRCVRDITPSAISSKVIIENNRVVIDNRDMPAGAITTQFKAVTTQATNSTAVPTNSTSDIASAESNKTVSYYFEVAKNDFSAGINWIGAINGCAGVSNDGNGSWRLPTQRELIQIWTLQETIKVKSSDFTALSSNYYWSATEISFDKSWYVLLSNGSAYISSKASNMYKVRCVRDLTPNEVTVNHLEWATGNLVADGKGGCKIGAPTDGGLYFQFGSLVGWSGGANGDGTGHGTDLVNPVLAVKVQPQDCLYTLTDWASTAKIWQGTTGTVPQSAPGTTGTNGIGDACRYYLGGTWRLPTQTECNALFGQTPAFTSNLTWADATAVGWDKGGSFTIADYGVAKHTKSGMQLPTAGYRINNGGVLTSVGVRGNYWSASPNGLYLNFYSTGVTPNNGSTRDNGFPIRCVRNVR